MRKWPDYKKLFKKEPEPAPQNITCKNCDTEFSGHYCPNCGQAVKEFDRPFSFVIYNFFGDFFSFDTRFFKTFYRLLFFPGKLTVDFFEGKRVRYAPPFRIFIFVSFILFFLLQVYTNQGLNRILDSSEKKTKDLALDSVYSQVKDSVLTKLKEHPEIDSIKINNISMGLENEMFNSSGNRRQSLDKFANYFEKKLAEEPDGRQRGIYQGIIRFCRSPEDSSAKLLKYLSWAFFLLLPVFALILKLSYIRRHQNYVRHLIFSIHIHSFLFLDFFLIILLNMLFDNFPGKITSFLFLIFPVYFIIAMKRFYKHSIGRAIVKFIGISFLYNIVFWVVVGFVFLNALTLF